MERTYLVSETYEIVTPESAKNGEPSETGYAFEDAKITAREIMEYMSDEGFCVPSSNYYFDGMWFSTHPEVNPYDGSETTRSLHVNVPKRILRVICQMLEIEVTFD